MSVNTTLDLGTNPVSIGAGRKEEQQIEEYYKLAQFRTEKNLFIYKPRKVEKGIIISEKSPFAIVFNSINEKTTAIEFDAMLKKHPEFNLKFCITENHHSVLIMAIGKNNPELAAHLCNICPDLVNLIGSGSVNLIGSREGSALSIAIGKPGLYNNIQSSSNIIRILVNAGVDINFPSQLCPKGFGNTPLSDALGKGNIPLINFLVAHGAKRHYALSKDKTTLIKQTFHGLGEGYYQGAKKQFISSKAKKFFLAWMKTGTSAQLLPREIVYDILFKEDRVYTYYHHQYTLAKRSIRDLNLLKGPSTRS
jgi:hypothetical protein